MRTSLMTMDTNKHMSGSARLGRWASRMLRGYLCRERQAVIWLQVRGVPARVATALLWIIKLGVFVVLFYAAFWLAVLFALAVAAAWTARSFDRNPKPDLAWREGHSGFGLYDKSEWRHDPGDPDEP